MANCVECGRTVDDFDVCTHGSSLTSSLKSRLGNVTTKDDNDDFISPEDRNQRKVNLFIAAPFAGLILDFIIPIWSTWYVSLVYIFLASALVSQIAFLKTSGGSLQAKSFLMGTLRNLNTISAIKLYSNSAKLKRNIAIWAISVASAFLLISCIGTPANSSALENRIQGKIDATTSLKMDATCPSIFVAIPGRDVTCHVRTFLGINLPVVIHINNPFQDPTWNLSL